MDHKDVERIMAQAKLVNKAVTVTTNAGKTCTVKVLGIASTGRAFARCEDETSHQKFNLYYDEIKKVE